MAKKKPLEQLQAAINDLPKSIALAPPDLSLGCDLLDLHVSGKIGQAVSPGTFLWLHGPSGSGKSFHAKTVMAEAANSDIYRDHRFVVIDGENGSNFDTAKFFGRRLADRMELLEVESLDHLYDALDSIFEEPAIVIVDSFDSWMPAAAKKKLDEDKKRRAEGKEPEGDYGMAHGKIHSNRLRLLVPKLARSHSILAGISQHRDNINKANPYSPKDVVPGGRAIKFWCHIEIETQAGTKIKREINGVDTPIGDNIVVKVVKNRVNGLRLSFEEQFYPTLGIDNIGTSIKWLKENKYITQAAGYYSLPFFEGKKYYLEELISKIEDGNLENELRELLQQGYSDYMSQMAVVRKSRYE
jgi:RecA/RadA recombinase